MRYSIVLPVIKHAVETQKDVHCISKLCEIIAKHSVRYSTNISYTIISNKYLYMF